MVMIKRASIFLGIFFQLIFTLLPIMYVFAWVKAPMPLSWLKDIIQLTVIPHPYVLAILHPLSFGERLFGLVVDTMPMGVELFILYNLIKLFRLYEKGEIFSINNVQHIRKIGYALFIGQLIAPIHDGLLGLVLTLHNPPGHAFASISFNQMNVAILLASLCVILISWVMAEACKLRDEHRLTI